MALEDSDELRMSTDTPEGGVVLRSMTNSDGERSAAFLPRALQRLDEEGHELAVHAQRQILAIERARRELDEVVPLLREKGVSWDSIGWLTGMVGRSAQNRWGDL